MWLLEAYSEQQGAIIADETLRQIEVQSFGYPAQSEEDVRRRQGVIARLVQQAQGGIIDAAQLEFPGRQLLGSYEEVRTWMNYFLGGHRAAEA